MANFLSGLLRALVRCKLDSYGVPDFLPWPGSEAPTLVVFAHEWGSSGASRWRLKRVLWGQSAHRDKLPVSKDESKIEPDPTKAPLGPVDLLALRYVGNPLSNYDPKCAALKFQECIHEQVEARRRAGHPYREVVLVGYSSGSLVLRKAIVWGLGQLEDHPDRELAARWRWRWALDESGTRLGDIISRVVLIAGVNRGWSLKARPKDMSKSRYATYKLLELVARSRLIGGFILALERGTPFVADLRLQWLRLADRLGGLPPTIQLLGTVDDIVSREDNKDVLALRNASLLLVDGADHNGILRLDDPKNGKSYQKRLVQALKGEVQADDVEAKAAHAATVTAIGGSKDQPISMIVLPVHGIRANSDWCYRFRTKLEASLADKRAVCPCESYGHFSILRFLLLPTRRRMVRWFVDLYTEWVAAVGDPKVPVHFVGHSNGTYLLARALLDYQAVVVDRVVLTGSVVQRHFPWKRLHEQHRIAYLRNERAARDLIVGFFPGFYQQLSHLLPSGQTVFDIGNSGLRGFDRPPAGQDVERFYLKGGHSAGVEEDNLQNLVDFVLDRPEQPRTEMVSSIPRWIDIFTNLSWLIWLLILAVVLSLLFVLPPLGDVILVIILVLIIATV